jgi:thiamine pyrophosphokinase
MTPRTALIVGAVASPGDSARIPELAASVDLVIAADGGAATLLAAGEVPALVVGDMDSLDEDARDVLTARGVQVERHPANKDVTDLDLALDACRRRGIDQVTVCGISGARLDHELVALGSLAGACDLAPLIVAAGFTGWMLTPAYRSVLTMRSPGSTVSIIALGTAIRVSCHGMRWSLDGERLEPFSSRGVSNVVVDAVATVEIHEGIALVIRNEP